jgi:hypothetical protein
LSLNELPQALIAGETESILLDVADALIAMEKWTGKLKVIGLNLELQEMSVGFPMSYPELRQASDEFFERYARSGSYLQLVLKYYPNANVYFPDFFRKLGADATPR